MAGQRGTQYSRLLEALDPVPCGAGCRGGRGSRPGWGCRVGVGLCRGAGRRVDACRAGGLQELQERSERGLLKAVEVLRQERQEGLVLERGLLWLSRALKERSSCCSLTGSRLGLRCSRRVTVQLRRRLRTPHSYHTSVQGILPGSRLKIMGRPLPDRVQALDCTSSQAIAITPRSVDQDDRREYP
eukprot:COSAG02_NODE_28366_length_591_cov_0.607724_1_plen_185_part_01